MGYKAALRVWRGDAGAGELADYQVEVNRGEVVLDVLHRLQATQAKDLAIRWNCKAGKCGSCSMEINGRPRLACMTRMSVFAPEETLTITPMRTFPVIRDLVTDVSFNYAKAREIPSVTPDPSVKPGEVRMQQVDVNRSQEFRKCIECFLCQNTCHVIRDHTENEHAFAGPRFLMRVAELEMHPADTADRREIAQDDFGLGYCNITKCCTEVCPEHIKITDNALIPMKERVAGRKYDPLAWLGSKISRREAADTAIGMIVYFWRDWLRIIGGFFSSLRDRRVTTTEQRLAWMIILATIPVGIVGLFAEHTFRVIFGKAVVAAWFLMLNGVILYAGERWRPASSKRADQQAAADRELAAQRDAAAQPALAPGPTGQRVAGRHASGPQAVRQQELGDAVR